MNQNLYLPRKLAANDRTYTEDALLASSKYVVVLAEPGAGKTELLKSMAQQLGTTAVSANMFIHVGAGKENTPLIIDAFDELAKIDQSGIHRLLAKAKKLNATHLIISSRSSEWGTASTAAFSEYIGQPPTIAKLCEFDQHEQQLIFDDHLPGEEFAAFQEEVSRFGLEALLPNPQFLKLFADAYIESQRRFVNKRSIFTHATERLAKEANAEIARSNHALPSKKKVDLSSEVFAKLLLSGSEGVCISEAAEHRTYPSLTSLGCDPRADCILATKLFKPGDAAEQHRPVHKIVAEYCAANYLTKRISDPSDPLTLAKCLPIIAPNSVVRDELRGLLGWMASLGNKSVQEAAIELDAYAVLANGDPSQLETSSKRLLVSQLRRIETEDPYFRRGDFWRRFSVAGFFTPEVVEEIRPFLAKRDGGGHLRNLLLELLESSPATQDLRKELHNLVLDPNENEDARLLASRCLHDATGDNSITLSALINEASCSSLKIAADIMERGGPRRTAQKCLADFFRASAKLYPVHGGREPVIGARYFIKRFVDSLHLDLIGALLEELTSELACICGKDPFDCHCRTGASKIVGMMLDRYFELATKPHDAAQIWRWISKVNFRESKTADQSRAVRVLQQDDDLRQGIIAQAFLNLTDREAISATRTFGFDWCCHSGLNFRPQDYKFVVNLAFDSDNPALWANFVARHQRVRSGGERGPNSLRRHMREQALLKPSFMREWAKSNRALAHFENENRLHSKHTRIMKRRRRMRGKVRAANIKYVQENRALVEGGRHWGCLLHFAELTLMSADKIEHEVGDELLVRNALRNCLDFIAPDVPDLLKLAELQCASKGLHVETVLYAACLEILRTEGNLEGVDIRLLQALRTNLDMHYSAVTDRERNALKNEVDRLIFQDTGAAESFLRRYVEPQLAEPGCRYPDIGYLRSDETFSFLRATLSIEWLNRFQELALEPLNSLFEIASQYGDRNLLNTIIRERCEEIQSAWPEFTGDDKIEKRREFWLLRAWYFLDEIPHEHWELLKSHKDTVFLFAERSGRMAHADHPYWPKLTPGKVEAILDAFIEQWPKVDLPSSWGSQSPKAENAYRFLTEVIWSLNSEDPDQTIPVLKRLLCDQRFIELHNNLKSILVNQIKKKALRDFEPPSVLEIVERLDHDAVVTVEGLRQVVLQELEDLQKAINGGEFNTADYFYEKGDRLGEVRSTEIIADRLNLRLEPQGISVTLEHQLRHANRCDFTATKMIQGKRRLLVTEVKGQWHKDLYTAASAQLRERYSIHPDAEQQGIFLAIWFGPDEMVAARKQHGIQNAQELKRSIETAIPKEISALIDVFVLDVSSPRHKVLP